MVTPGAMRTIDQRSPTNSEIVMDSEEVCGAKDYGQEWRYQLYASQRGLMDSLWSVLNVLILLSLSDAI